jgi:hypothetical protein
MRGWWGHSVEHSLAARGYLYHGTASMNLEKIKKRGLVSDESKLYECSRDFIYLTTDEEEAKHFGGLAYRLWSGYSHIDDLPSESIIIRVDREKLREYGKLFLDPEDSSDRYPWPYDDALEDYYKKLGINTVYLMFDGKSIPPEIMEIRDKDGKWRPLK